MPNRILRDWTDSDRIDLIDVQTERFFTRLIMKVDDYGRYLANIKLLKSHLFPLKSDIRETDISRWLTECKKSGLIALYSVANKEYLQINDFRQVLRQKVEKYPPPNECDEYDMRTTSECLSDNIPEKKRNRNETETETKPASPPILIEFPFSENFKNYWTQWKNYKKTEHRFNYKSPQSEQSSLKDLVEKSGGVEETAIKIIQQAMASGWKGFYELKISGNGHSTTKNGKQPTGGNVDTQSAFDKIDILTATNGNS